MIFFHWTLLLTIALTGRSFAASCSASQTGILKWRGDGATNSVLYCDGQNWQNSDHGNTAVSCSSVTTGTVSYSGTVYRFCAADGNWHTMKGSNIGTCSVSGNAYFNGLDWVFCDGTNLYSMNPNLSCVAVLTAGTSWAGKTSFATPNQIKVLGGGGGGGGSAGNFGGAGGGGGAYNSMTNVTMTFPVTYAIGAGGAGGAANGGNGTAGGDTWICSSNALCSNIIDSNVLVGAKGGSGGQGEGNGGAGGDIASNKPASMGYSGGAGANGNSVTGNKGAGGGGAAGPSGAGVASTGNTGGKGDAGAGGAAGAAGTDWGSGVGSGGGGSGPNNAAVGNPGGLYGSGGSGSGKAANRAGGAGTAGLIYISWTSTTGNCN